MKKGLKITFVNPNTEEQIVQAMAGILAYNLAESDDKITFDYKNSSSYQNFHEEMDDEELKLWKFLLFRLETENRLFILEYI